MTLIEARGIEKCHGGKPVLRGLNMRVGPGARIGLVGGNGAGKSTLLRLLAGLDTVDAGELVRRRGLRVALLPQHVEGGGQTPLEVVLDARPEVSEVRRELEACEAELGSPEVEVDMRRMQRVLERHGRLMESFQRAGGRGFEGEACGYLRALGFADADMVRPTSELSDGQRKLAALAACLAQNPDVLLLDEPEAHLDGDRREELEGRIRTFDGAVVAVSHDRYLLDEVAQEMAELENGAVTMWPGNYSAYAVARELKMKRQQQLYVAQQNEIARLEEAIRRFQLWASMVVNERHIKQARNKQRQIERMDKIERPALERRRIGLELREASMAFGDEPVLIGADLTIVRGERVGIVGPNGAGKSVLAKLLAGELQATEGERWAGPSIRIGYLAQDHQPPPGATLISLVRNAKPMYEGEAVSLLGRFLFRYEQARQPISALSGGERTRLGLLLLMLGEPNCLVLDEPTNHLDIDSLEVLEAELERFPGTLVFVSHDRYFLDRIADRIVEVRDGEVSPHAGGYTAYREEKLAAFSVRSKQ